MTTPAHKTPDPGWCGDRSRGAGMGRSGDNLDALIIEATDAPFTLQQVRLDNGGYDQGGAYWGHHQRLYWWSVTITEGDATDECSGYFRAPSRTAAKSHILELHPLARFFR